MIVYIVVNRHNGKFYVGMTKKTVKQRWHDHCKLAFKPREGRTQSVFHTAIKHHGIDAFELFVLQTCSNREEMCAAEKYWIARLDATNRDKGYNLALGGDGGEMSPDVRARMSVSARNRKRKVDAEWRRSMSEAARGKVKSPEHLKHMSESQKGKPKSEESRRKMSISQRAKAPPTSETREKISKSLTGKPRSEEARLAISEGHRRRREKKQREKEEAQHEDRDP